MRRFLQLALDLVDHLVFHILQEAPGHTVCTTMTRKVKSGSSFWPIWVRPSAPAMMMSPNRKRAMLGWAIAQRDRLKRCFSPEVLLVDIV